MQPPIGEPTLTGPATSAPLPERIGRYLIQDRLGAGGMGTVYKARDPELDRVVALKMPRFDVSPAGLGARVQRFQREARAAAGIWHPHVCPIYDVGEQDGQPYVVMAYVEGESLAERLAREGRCTDPVQAVRVVRQVLEALEAVHARGIVHRDLKAGNIMLDRAGRAILMDFGLARRENDAEHLTSDGVILGTPSYMAPEQAAGKADRVGSWTDLYSVGVVLYQMLTGRLPFQGPPLTVLACIMVDEPPRPSTLQPGLDSGLEAVVLKAMAREPGQRYQSAREFIAALDGWLASRGLSALVYPDAITTQPPESKLAAPGTATEVVRETPPTGTTTAAEKPKGTRWRLWLLLGCGSATVLLLVPCVGLLIILQRGPGFSHKGPPPVHTAKEASKEAGPISRPELNPKLFDALAKGQRVYVQELLDQGADPNAKDPSGQTPLMKLAAGGDVPMLLVLAEAGRRTGRELRVNERDNNGETALMKAAENGQVEIVRLLIPVTSGTAKSYGTAKVNLPGNAEVNEVDNKGQTALAKAEAKALAPGFNPDAKYGEIVELLKKAGAR